MLGAFGISLAKKGTNFVNSVGQKYKIPNFELNIDTVQPKLPK